MKTRVQFKAGAFGSRVFRFSRHTFFPCLHRGSLGKRGAGVRDSAGPAFETGELDSLGIPDKSGHFRTFERGWAGTFVLVCPVHVQFCPANVLVLSGFVTFFRGRLGVPGPDGGRVRILEAVIVLRGQLWTGRRPVEGVSGLRLTVRTSRRRCQSQGVISPQCVGLAEEGRSGRQHHTRTPFNNPSAIALLWQTQGNSSRLLGRTDSTGRR